MEIKFTNITEYDLSEFSPKPASKCLPEWYKKTEPYAGNKKIPNELNNIPSTIKKCLPVFDAITSGYIIFTPADIYIKKHENADNFFYQWKLFEDLIKFHPLGQADLHPQSKSIEYPKLLNPWAIKTSKGYSCLFLQPMHQDLPFTILPGIVDTDKYNSPVNFIFTLNDPNFEGMIEAGTPIVQVIPFKRDTWNMRIGNEKDVKESLKAKNLSLSKFFDGYKNFFWERKQYK
jgi:hypothetical protein